MKILVTGLNGLIGWNVFEESRKRDFLTFGTYRQLEAFFAGDPFFRIDIRTFEEVEGLIREIRPDIVIHCWSMCDLDTCESHPDLAHDINVLGTEHFLAACEKLIPHSHFIYMSTDHVFSGDEGAYSIEDSTQPKHVYGKTKVAAEKRVQQSSLNWTIVRPGLVLGASPQGNKGPRDFLFHRIKAGKLTHYFEDEWRSTIEASELASKVINLAQNRILGIYHFSDQDKLNRVEIAKMLAQKYGYRTDLIRGKMRCDDDLLGDVRPRDLSLTGVKSN